MNNRIMINCWIDMILKVYPHISEYIIYLNTWGLKIDIIETDNSIDYSGFFYAEWLSQLHFVYGFVSHIVKSRIQPVLKKGIPVFLICDNSHLPYHTNYTGKQTGINHLILVQSYSRLKGYYIFDDILKYEGFLGKKFINKIWRANGKLLAWIEVDSKRIVNKNDQLKYMHDNLILNQVSNKSFFDKLINMNIDEMAKLKIINNLKGFVGCYNGLLKILLALSCEFDNYELNDYITTVKTYIDSWKLILALTDKGLISNAKDTYKKVETRVERLVEYEANINKVINCLKHEVLSEILQDYNLKLNDSQIHHT